MTRTGGLLLLASSIAFVAVASPRAFAQTQTPSPSQTPQTPAQPLPAPATPPAPAAPSGRAILTAVGGTSFGNTEASGLFGGGIGFILSPHFQIGAEVGHDGNLTSKTLHDNLRDASASLSLTEGAPVSYSVSAPEVYGLASMRYWVKTSDHVGVFFKVGVGVAHIAPKFSAAVNGTDVSSQVLTTVPVPSTQTSFLASFDAGLSFKLSARSSIDGGYRFSRISATSPVNANGLYAALQARF